MKFKIGEVVRKTSGYRFVGVVRAAYEVEGGERYDVQVDGNIFADEIRTMITTGAIAIEHSSDVIENQLLEYASNCHGMIHIFSDSQLDIY